MIFRRELLNTFKRNYALIATEYQQMIKKLNERRKELASLEQMEKMNLDIDIERW